MKNIKWITLFGLMALPLMLAAQSGDEAEMTNKAKARDQAAINEAVNGWWKESMKNHEQRIGWWRDA